MFDESGEDGWVEDGWAVDDWAVDGWVAGDPEVIRSDRI